MQGNPAGAEIDAEIQSKRHLGADFAGLRSFGSKSRRTRNALFSAIRPRGNRVLKPSRNHTFRQANFACA